MKEKRIFFMKNVSEPFNPPDELAQKCFEKIPSDPFFFFENSESDRLFNFLHDSNSIFRAGGINPAWVFRCTVRECKKENVKCKRNQKKT